VSFQPISLLKLKHIRQFVCNTEFKVRSDKKIRFCCHFSAPRPLEAEWAH